VPALSAMTFGHASQCAQNRPIDQRISRWRRRRRKRTLLFVYGYFGDGDVGHYLSLGPIYLPRRDTS
jgi:hypothetical protein